MQITTEEILAELERANKGNPDAMTTRELMAQTGLGEKVINKWLRIAQASGCLQVHQVIRTDLAGRPYKAPAYIVIRKKKK